MDFPAQEEKKKPKKPKMFTMKDLDKLNGIQNNYSCFGNMVLSTKETGARATFGTAHRDKMQKVYSSKADMKAFLGDFNLIQEKILKSTMFILTASRNPIYRLTVFRR